MSVTLNPYLNFRGDARAALEFYRDALGGETTTMTFAEGGMVAEGVDPDQLMHGQLDTPAGITLMCSDTPSYMEWRPGQGTFSVSLSGDDAAALRGYWDGLADGATINQPLSVAPWGDEFGMLTDRFGVSWLVNITGQRTPGQHDAGQHDAEQR